MGVFTDLLDLIYPPSCGACEMALIDGENEICTRCRLQLPYSSSFIDAHHDLQTKFTGRIPFTFAIGLFEYRGHGLVKRLLANVKYNNKPGLARELGKWMADKYLHSYLASQSVDVLLPIPLHVSKLRSRGYNQSEEIAKGIQSKMGWQIDTQSIIRTRANKSQTTLDRWKRWENSENLFALTDKANGLSNKNVVIVDDVVTTGATLDNIYSLLKNLDVKSVSLMVIAHTK